MAVLLKPSVLVDIKGKSAPFLRLPKRINFKFSKTFFSKAKLALSQFLKITKVVIFLIIFLGPMLNFVTAPSISQKVLAAPSTNEERRALEAELKAVEDEIARYEVNIKDFQHQAKTLKQEMDRLGAKITKINLQIKATTLTLKKLDQEIVLTEKKIAATEIEMNLHKDSLAKTLRTIYEEESTNLIEILLKNPKLSDFFGKINNLISIQENIQATLQKVINLRDDYITQKEQLALQRADATSLKAWQDSQGQALKNTKTEKDQLLTTTKGQESRYQQLVKESKKTAAQIRSRIFELLGGGELTFEEAYKLAKFAESATGVRAALILAVLDRESALGRNVGRCNYKTAMHPTRDIPLFLEITKELNINPDSVSVSCPNADGAYGGAMGPAQFIPSTWVIYKDQIKQITGSDVPSPWRNADAFVATALYLKDAGAVSGSLSSERKAAAKYYAGSRWQRFLWTYGERVLARAESFEEDIKALGA